MTSQFFIRMFTIAYKTILVNTEGISHQESTQVQDAGGNSINWVIGHIINSRVAILKLVGVTSAWDEEHLAVYSRGSSGQSFTEFKQLEADLGKTQEQLISVLKTIKPEDLRNEIRPGKTVADDLAFLFFHEAYHAGQIGLLRRLVGKSGAIQ